MTHPTILLKFYHVCIDLAIMQRRANQHSVIAGLAESLDLVEPGDSTADEPFRPGIERSGRALDPSPGADPGEVECDDAGDAGLDRPGGDFLSPISFPVGRGRDQRPAVSEIEAEDDPSQSDLSNNPGEGLGASDRFESHDHASHPSLDQFRDIRNIADSGVDPKRQAEVGQGSIKLQIGSGFTEDGVEIGEVEVGQSPGGLTGPGQGKWVGSLVQDAPERAIMGTVAGDGPDSLASSDVEDRDDSHERFHTSR